MYLAYLFLFATASAIPTGRVEVVFPSVETSRSGVKTVKFRALGEDVELKLEPAGDILAKDFAFYNGNHEKQHSVDVESLRRRLYRDTTNGAALLIDDDRQPPSIEGFVVPNLSIGPHESKEITDDGKRAHKVEELTNDRDFHIADDIIIPDIQREIDNFTGVDGDDQCLVVEVLGLIESRIRESYKTNEAFTEYMTLIYSGAETLLRQLDSRLQIRLIGIQVFTKETEPPFFRENELDNKEYYNNEILSAAGNYYCVNSTSSSKADLIVLHLSRTIKKLRGDGSSEYVALGITYAGSVCWPCYSVAVILSKFNLGAASVLLAHEMAHSLGVPHDGESPSYTGVPGSPGAKSCPYYDGFLMGGRSEANSRIFSNCSKDCAQHLFSRPAGSCLREECKKSRY